MYSVQNGKRVLSRLNANLDIPIEGNFCSLGGVHVVSDQTLRIKWVNRLLGFRNPGQIDNVKLFCLTAIIYLTIFILTFAHSQGAS